MRIRCKFSIAAVFLLSLSMHAWTQESRLANIDERTMTAWMEQVQSDIEQLLGYKLPKSLRYMPVNERFFLQVYAPRDLVTHLRWRYLPALKKDASLLHDALRDNKQVTAVRYAEETDVVLVCLEKLEDMAKWDDSLKEVNSPQFLLLSLVHEAVRSALDARYNLDACRKNCVDPEEWFALKEIVEGRAQWVTKQVAKKLKYDSWFPLLMRVYQHVPTSSAKPKNRAASMSAQQQRAWAGVRGLRFFEYLAEQKQDDSEKSLFRRPPRHVQSILEPKLYLSLLQSNRADPAKLLAKMEESLPAKSWEVRQQAWNPAMVEQLAALRGLQNLASLVRRSWLEGRAVVWNGKDEPWKHISIRVARLQQPRNAGSCFDLMTMLHRKRDVHSVSQVATPQRVTRSQSKPVKLDGVDEATLFERTLVDHRNIETSQTILLCRLGNTVAEIIWHGAPANLTWAEEMVALLQNRDG